jgi:ABC-2 type transport system ATP-binding protein
LHLRNRLDEEEKGYPLNSAIETRNLTKQYPHVRAVDDVSLCVASGEIYAFLGLNGAGKTTTIRMLLGMINKTGGDVRVLGQPVPGCDRQLWGSIGYLVETPHAYPELSVRENLDVIRRLRPGVPPGAVAEVIEKIGLHEYADRPTGTLSLGNAQRLGLAKALMHQPKLLILDEPANGLDPAGIVEVRELLRTLAREEGASVFMSSHILGEVSRIADRIGIIHEGRLLQELDVDELEKNRKRRLLVRTRDIPAALSHLRSQGYHAELNDDGELEVTDDRALDRPDDVASSLVTAGFPPLRLQTDLEDLEHYFLRLVGVHTQEAV